MADAINQEERDVQFWLVGHLKYPEKYSSYAGLVNGLTAEPLSNEEYARRAEGITYAVGIADNPDRYRLVASASFLDSISFIKPGIYLRNPYIAFYFDKIGDIGYLCDSLEEMRKVILQLVSEFPTERYRQQQMNILQGRQIFEPQRVAEQFRNITIEFGL